jgi:hypothetical protein
MYLFNAALMFLGAGISHVWDTSGTIVLVNMHCIVLFRREHN